MRRTSIALALLILASPAAAAPPAPAAKPAAADEAVYDMGRLEVKARDLSRPDVEGSGRKAGPVAKGAEGARRVARLVDLGDGELAVGAKRRSAEAFGTIGSFATVKSGAAWSWSDADGSDNRARIDYASTDGYRFRSDSRAVSATFDSAGRPAGAARLDLHGGLADGRERMPGAVGFEPRFLERVVRGYAVRADLGPGSGATPVTGTLDLSGDAIEGTSAALGLDDDASVGRAMLRAEWRPAGKGDFTVGVDAASHSLDVDRAKDVRSSDAGIAARYKFEAGGTLVSTEAGLRKSGDRDAEPEGDLTVRRKLGPRSSVHLSAGARTDAYAFRDVLLPAPGYVNLRDAAGENRFAGLERPARRARYAEGGARFDLDRGWIDLDLSAETVDGELVHVVRNATDATVDALAATDGADIRTARAAFTRPLDDRFRLELSALSRKATEARGDLPFRPESEARAALGYADGRTKAEVAAASFGGFAVDFAGARVGGHAELDLSVEREVADGLTAELSADNALDRAHDLRPGFPARGRLVSGGIRYKF